MKQITLSIILCFTMLLSACAAPQTNSNHEIDTGFSEVYSTSIDNTEKVFFASTTIEIIDKEEPFYNYQIPDVNGDEFKTYVETLLDENILTTDLQAFCEHFGVDAVKVYHSSFYGDVYCTVVKTDGTLRFCTFISEGKDIWSFIPVYQSSMVSRNMFNFVKTGDSIDVVKRVDNEAVYHESYGSMGYPAISIHYTKDECLIYIEYDHELNVVDIVTMSI